MSSRATKALTVTWEPPASATRNGILQDYFISYSDSTGGVVNRTTPLTEVQLVGLDEFTVYNIAVRASTTAGAGPEALIQGTTLSTGKGLHDMK